MKLNQKVCEFWDICHKRRRDFGTDLRGECRVCQKVEVMRLEKKRRLLYDKPLNRINH